MTGHGQVERLASTHNAPQSALSLKLLFLLPFAPDLRGSHGGARATAEIIEMLSRHHRVCVLYLSASGDPPPRQLPTKCEKIVAIPKVTSVSPRSLIKRWVDTIGKVVCRPPDWAAECWSQSIAHQVAEIAAEFGPDVVHHEFHVMAQYVPIIRSACPSAACIITEHEPGTMADARPGSSLTLRERLGALARRRAWQRYERRVLNKVDAIIVFTSTDRAALKQLLGPTSPPITVIPLRLSQQSGLKPADRAAIKSDFLFVGNFGHPPNADAARRLVSTIFPRILRELPGATLAIVGANPPADVRAAASDRLIVTGWVDDPAVYLAGAAVVLVPLRQGGGLRVKMLEACAAGKAIVASRTAIEGLLLEDGNNIVLAEDDEEFAANAIALRRSAGARARLERASRRWWEAQNDIDQWFHEYANFYATLTGRSECQRPAAKTS